jgi:hypothetical protein
MPFDRPLPPTATKSRGLMSVKENGEDLYAPQNSRLRKTGNQDGMKDRVRTGAKAALEAYHFALFEAEGVEVGYLLVRPSR